MYAWISQLEDLSPAELTVRAQAVSPNEGGALKWDVFFPRRDVNSTKLKEITTISKRYASGRREWNAPERLIPIDTPNVVDMEMIPLGAYFPIGEEEMQHLEDAGRGNQDVVMEAIGADIPTRVDGLIESNYRQLELDTFEAWTKGTITAKDPQTGRARTASFGFDTDRYPAAGTAWDDAGTNAWEDFLAEAKNALDMIGSLSGALTRRAVIDAILEDAPTSAITGFRYTLADLAKRVRDELGTAFDFMSMETTVEVFTDGGVTTTTTKVFDAGLLAFLPASGIVGNVAAAPVVRARQIAREVPEARIDIRGQAVYYIEMNEGKGLKVATQANMFPVPNEQNVYVVDTGIA